MVWIDISHDSVGVFIYSVANFVHKILARFCNFANAKLNDLLEMIAGKIKTLLIFNFFPISANVFFYRVGRSYLYTFYILHSDE